MCQLPKIQSNCSRITNLFYNAVSSKLLITAIHLKVFDYIDKPITAKELSFILSSHSDNTKFMLDALCACGLAEKEGDKYKNTTESNELLVTGKPAYIGDWLKLADEEINICLEKLQDLICSGPASVPEREHMNSEIYCELFTNSHAATSLAGIARDMACEIASIPEFANCHNILDLGGGPGINAMAVIEKYSNLKATVIDRPEIIKYTKQYITKYGFEKRVKAVSGDYLNDCIGEGYDMIMITDSLYYDSAKIKSVLKKCYSALKPNGFFVGIHAVLSHSRTQPTEMVLGMLTDALSNKGFLPNQGFLELELEDCGFKKLSSKMISIGGSPMEMNIGYRI